MRRTLATLTLAAVALAVVGPAHAQEPLANLRFDLVGARLVVDPPSLTVPKDIPTSISTALVLPAGLDAENAAALRTLAASAVVVAELRGPSLPAQQIRVRAGEPIPIRALPLAGEYRLDRIRLEKDGATLLDATPASVPIQVIDQVLVTSVTTRPLSLAELQGRGVLIDESSFTAYDFELTLDVDGTPLRIGLPVVYPRFDLDGLNSRPPAETIEFATDLNRELASLATVELPPEIERPGLDISILAVPFFPVGGDESVPNPFGAPPLVGLVVIPGQVAFLNGFFSALVQVVNVAPADSRLSVRDVMATISLPPGPDRVPGTPDAPGDDPLRLARFDGGVVRDRVAVLGAGPDAAHGTADDASRLEPGDGGEGEFVIEGRTEGAHSFDIALDAVLDGLPSGPVELQGTAAGAVLVRNPTFAVSFSHPRTVRASEPYDLFVTVTNTSQDVANLVSVQLDKRSVSGARLDSEDAVRFETLGPYESGTARFRLTAQRTGSVTATYLRTGAGLEGGLSLRTGVDERDVPLQPDQIVLPRDTAALPDALVVAAQRVLGQTLGIARAPAGTLPPDVLPIRYSTLTERGRALGFAGQRLVFGDTLLRSVADLVLDWSDAPPDTGFDQLLRETDAGADLLAAAGDALAMDPYAAPLDRFDALADALAPRAPPLLAFAAPRSGPAVAVLPGDSAALPVPLPDANLAVRTGSGAASLLPVGLLAATGNAAARIDVGVAVPLAAGGVAVLHFGDVEMPAGATARLEGDATLPATVRLVVDRDGDGRGDVTLSPAVREIPDRAPGLIAARQLDTSTPGRAPTIRDPAYHGLLFAVLFDEPVDAAAIDELTRWSVEANGVRDVALQPSGRLVHVLLEKGIGTWIPRKVAIDGVTDLRGNVAARLERTIDAILSDGGDLSGQVQSADGMPVGGGQLLLTVIEGQAGFTPSSLATDAQGRFAFDFVRRTRTGYQLLAQHPVTGEIATARGSIRGAGDSVYTRVLFQARGSARGRVLGIDGAPVAGAAVTLRQSFGETLVALSDAAGEWVIPDVPVGAVTVRAIATNGKQGFAEGFLGAPGAEVVVDVMLTTLSSDTGDVAGRVFDSDGATPVAGAAVYLGSYDRRTNTMSVLAQTTSDGAGAFSFLAIPGNTGHDVVALDAGSGRFGVSHVGLVRVGTTTAVNVVFEATGTVTGTVRDASGNPVDGALVSGGTALATTDANGRFSTVGVPAGRRRLEAANPVTKRRGSAEVTVPPGGSAEIEILLEARASIVGVVRDAAGNAVPNVSVRLPRSGGFFFVFANEEGRFLFPDMAVDNYLVQAPGPPVESLVEWMKRQGIPLEAAFTLGIPPKYGGDPAPIADERSALRAYASAVTALFNATESRLASLPDPPPGGFGWSRAVLVNDQQIEDASVKYLPQGRVAGTTVDGNGDPIAAAVRLLALIPGPTGAPLTKELVRGETEPLIGTFDFGALVARFDLATFQRSGVRAGEFAVEGSEPFTRAFVRETGRLDSANLDQLDVELRFGGDDLVRSISGTVFLPDGETPAPENTEVFVPVDLTGVTVRTDSDGHYRVEAPIRAGSYALVATEPVSGLRGTRTTSVRGGEDVVADIRLLGLGAVDVRVLRPDGSRVERAHVVVERSSFPGDSAEGDAAADGTVRFENLTEGYFAVFAEDLATGVMGRANGTIARDGVVAVDVVVQATGTVSGRLVGPTGMTPVADAQVKLTIGNVNAFTRTGTDGTFALEAVPVGSFSIDTEDPKSGRRGTASGRLRSQGDRVDVLVRQTGLGIVEGRVLTAAGEPVAGVDVGIAASAGSTATYRTSAADGSFRFGAVGEGPFTLRAYDPVSRFEGSAAGVLRFEGETVRQDVSLEAFGAIEVQVVDADGAPAGNAEVTITPERGVQAHSRPGPSAVDPDGRVRFEFLALGTWTVEARSLADPNDRGRTVALVEATPDAEQALVTLRGTGTVAVTVLDAGGAPAPGARVVLSAQGYLDDEPFLPFGVQMIAGAEADGVAHFSGVPLGAFDVLAERGTVAGVANGAIATPGAAESIVVELGPAGSVVGRALLPDGVTPAFETIVTLRFQPRTTLHSGVLQVRSELDGTFSFGGIPLGPFTVDLFEPVSLGLAHRDAGFDASGPSGQLIDLGDLVLDASSPRLVATVPPDGASGVAVDAAIELEFSEPMLRSSFRTDGNSENVSVRIGANPVAGSVSFTDGDRRLVFQPRDPLPSSALVTVTVDGAPGGPRDLVQLPVPDRSVVGFQVADVIPPRIDTADPEANATGVRLDAVVRVAFDEAMDSGLRIALEDGSGAPVAGDTAFALGDTVAIFTPRDFLAANQSYRARFADVRDRAGNAIELGFDGQQLAGAPLELAFATIDTIPPRLTALALAGAPSRIEGSTVRVVPELPDGDAVQVVYRVAGSAPVTVAAPFALDLVLPRHAAQLDVSAEAVDAAGNHSGAQLLAIPIVPDDAPDVALVAVTPEGDVAAGGNVQVRLVASDDVGLASVAASASGAFSATQQRAPGGAVGYEEVLQFAVPADAPTGAVFEIGAAASDLGGATASAPPLRYAVRDGTGPVVSIASPVAGAQVVPGETIEVVVNAQDSGGVASVTLGCTPAATGCGVRSLAAAPASTTQRFAVIVPPTLVAPDAFTLIASALDSAGNASASSPASARSLRAADATAPEVVELSAPAGLLVAPGQVATLHVRATDAVGVRSIRLSASGAAPPLQERAITPARTDVSADFSITVPADALDGAAVEVRASARDAALESAERTLTLRVEADATAPVVSVLEPTADTAVRPGSAFNVRVHAEDERGVARVEVATSGAFETSQARDAVPPLPVYEPVLSLSVPAGAPAGAVSLRVAAIDAAGNRSEAVVPLRVLDIVAPTLSIVAPIEGAEIDPRTPLAVEVAAQDGVALASLQLQVAGAAGLDEFRPVSGTSATETFTVAFGTAPPEGGTLLLSATATDADGNAATVQRSVAVRDVVPPTVVATTPLAGATDVALEAILEVVFSEPMDAASVGTALRLETAAGTPVDTALVIDATGRSAQLTPTALLAPATDHVLRIDASATDRHGIALLEPLALSFRTAQPDDEPPRVLSTSPPDGATEVSLTKGIVVNLSEPIDCASVDEVSFQLVVAGAPVAGARSCVAGQPTLRFTPAAPLPLEAAVEIQLTDAVRDRAGLALVAPYTFGFSTASFSLVRPREGEIWIEGERVRLLARRSTSLPVSSVRFEVDGQSIADAGTTDPEAFFTVPPATEHATLHVAAVALDGSGGEIARDELDVAVGVGLAIEPPVVGVPLGGSARVRLRLTSATPTDLPVTLVPILPGVVGPPAGAIVIPAGARETVASLDGLAVGATGLRAESALATGHAVASVSAPVTGRPLQVLGAALGAQVRSARPAGTVAIAAGATQSISVPFLADPAPSGFAVAVVPSDPAIAAAPGGASVAAGSSQVQLTVQGGVAGIATLRLSGGGVVRVLTVVVGEPPPGLLPVALAPLVGTQVPRAPTLGTAVLAEQTTQTFSVLLLDAPEAIPPSLVVTSSDPSIASIEGTPYIEPGTRVAVFTVRSGGPGRADLTLRADGVVRSFTVVSGTPPEGAVPLIVADGVGVRVPTLRSLGTVRLPAGGMLLVPARLFEVVTPAPVPVAVSSDRSDVATVAGAPVVAAGSDTAFLDVRGGVPGRAVLELRAGLELRRLTVEVGDPSDPSATLAPAIGVEVDPAP